MRGFLIFLAIAIPMVLVNPIFWSLVSMQVGVERVGYVRNCITQWASLGPLAPWPEWAPVPDGGKLTVRAKFEATAVDPATGFGDIELKDVSAQGRETYAHRLEQAGWMVQVGHFDTLSPDLPPRPMHVCIIEAHQGVRGLLFSYDRGSESGIASLHWAEGKLPETMKYAKPGAC